MGQMESTSLLDGHFDETDAAVIFQKALLAWCGGWQCSSRSNSSMRDRMVQHFLELIIGCCTTMFEVRRTQ